jgi:hypothetical protein
MGCEGGSTAAGRRSGRRSTCAHRRWPCRGGSQQEHVAGGAHGDSLAEDDGAAVLEPARELGRRVRAVRHVDALDGLVARRARVKAVARDERAHALERCMRGRAWSHVVARVRGRPQAGCRDMQRHADRSSQGCIVMEPVACYPAGPLEAPWSGRPRAPVSRTCRCKAPVLLRANMQQAPLRCATLLDV